jgi:hypothetical protein
MSQDITDTRQLPAVCSCGSNMQSYNRTRTDRYSYEKRYRIERSCLNAVGDKYQLYEICIDNTRSAGYAVGDYIQVEYGTPSLLIYVAEVNPQGDITDIVLVNRPLFDSLPNSPMMATTKSGVGRGAIVFITVANNNSQCCNCGIQVD